MRKENILLKKKQLSVWFFLSHIRDYFAHMDNCRYNGCETKA